jgi:hypothetical protein
MGKKIGRAARAGAAIAGLIFVASCVKTVYLPEDANHYRQMWEKCAQRHLEAEKELDQCRQLGESLLRCP